MIHTDTLIVILIGALSGLSSGMFGIGGALLATPLLKIGLGLTPLLALATPLPATLPSAVSGSIGYARKHILRFDIAWRVLVFAMPMNILGAYLTRFTPGSVLMIATGIMLLYSAWTFLRRGWKKQPMAEQPVEEKRFGALACASGALTGFISGFLAIGGGAVMVPAFVAILGLPMKQALATSLLCVAALAIPGVVVHHLNGSIDWSIALLLCLVVVPFSYLGARLASALRTSTLEKTYGGVMLAFALYFIIINIY